MNIPSLLAEIKTGSRAAQKCLFELLAGRMMLVCTRYVKKHEDAEEVLLDGFMKCFSHLKNFQYQNDPAFYGWVKKIMVNECLMFLRKKKVFLLLTDTDISDTHIPEEAFSNLSAEEIYALILQLPLGYRTVFNLNVMEGFEHKEIAALLNISIGTSKSQLSKAKSLLQKMLAQNGINYAKQQIR